MRPKRRGRLGFTLMEAAVVLFLTAIMMMALTLCYQSALRVQADILARLPLSQAAANMSTILTEFLRSATCVSDPAGGSSGTRLLALMGPDWKGQGCDAVSFDSGKPNYAVFCVGAQKRLMFKRGTAPLPGPKDCAPPGDSGWYALSPGDVQVQTAAFRRSNQTPNVINADFRFSQSLPLRGEKAQAEVLWSSTITFQSALESP